MKENFESAPQKDPVTEGLCAFCMNARRIGSARGSSFILCELSLTDPRFAKYPRLPVLACDGYKKSS
jgi:hypothetical protein